MKIWKFGIIGTGVIAKVHYKAISELPNAVVAGCFHKDSNKAEKFASSCGCKAYTKIEDVLACPEVDIVIIASPSGLHMESAVLAAEYGKHVLCEKPLEVTLDKIDSMIEAHNRAGTKLGVIFQNRYADFVPEIKRAINTNRFGKLTFASAQVPWWRREDYYQDSSWHGTWKLDGGGALMNQAIHQIDLLCYLMGGVKSVMAYSEHLARDIEAEDTSVAALKFNNGALGFIYGTTVSWPGRQKRLELTGTKGTVVCVGDSIEMWQFDEENERDQEIRQLYKCSTDAGGTSDPKDISLEYHRRNIADFIASLEGKYQYALEGTEARKAVEVIVAIYRSSKEEKIVFL